MIRNLRHYFTIKSVFVWRFFPSPSLLLESGLLENFRHYDILYHIKHFLHKVCVRCRSFVRVDFTPFILVLIQEAESDKGSRYFLSKESCVLKDLFEDDVLDCAKDIFD